VVTLSTSTLPTPLTHTFSLQTTAINVLTGFLEPSGGSAVVEGLDISVHMNEIYRLMGVCPQHDLLWEQLTGEEHLLFYGRLKGFDSEWCRSGWCLWGLTVSGEWCL
jgi:ABC-type Na+ transport system ATPase subunit NatA